MDQAGLLALRKVEAIVLRRLANTSALDRKLAEADRLECSEGAKGIEAMDKPERFVCAKGMQIALGKLELALGKLESFELASGKLESFEPAMDTENSGKLESFALDTAMACSELVADELD